MKTLLLAVTLLLAMPVWAQNRGIGVSIGNPTGLNGKYLLGGNKAVDGGLAWSLGKKSNFSMHSDYLIHEDSAFFFNDVHPLDLYYGIGGRIEFDDDMDIGVRVPVGLLYKVEEGKADMFGEAAPIVDFIGTTGLELHLMIGARYYF